MSMYGGSSPSRAAMVDNFNRLSMQAGRPCRPLRPGPSSTFYQHSSATRVNTDAVLASSIRAAHPNLELTIIPAETVNLTAYAQGTGKASFEAIIDPDNVNTVPLIWKTYLPPAERLHGQEGIIASELKYGKFFYRHKGNEYILYVVDCRDGTASYPVFTNQYLLHGKGIEVQSSIEDLMRDAGKWSSTLHGEIWVFNSGYWQKDASLWQNIMKSSWDNVILDQDEKSDLRSDAKKFFDSEDRYSKYKVSWKRGLIYYGPPGNGKTISIKALSHELYDRTPSVSTLYVRSFTTFGGPEFGIKQIFDKARSEAPCLLVFEDLDSLVTDQVRSYFLNEVDGLNANSGIYMIGSTNHMERLDPGISKRPSRFDRKFEFPKPDFDQRIAYSEYWRHKLDNDKHKNNVDDSEGEEDTVIVDADEIDFPEELSPEIARITDDFSFAYMQEAFVATLLTIVDEGNDNGKYWSYKVADGGKKDKFEHLLFWRIIKKQIELLRDQI